MEIRKIQVNESEYMFVNEFVGNRIGFKHITQLFKNDYAIGDYSCQYYNRTWESYDYQSVMRNCISDIIDNKLKCFINEYKRTNNISRLTKIKKEELEKEFNYQEEIIKLRQVYEELQYSR